MPKPPNCWGGMLVENPHNCWGGMLVETAICQARVGTRRFQLDRRRPCVRANGRTVSQHRKGDSGRGGAPPGLSTWVFIARWCPLRSLEWAQLRRTFANTIGRGGTHGDRPGENHLTYTLWSGVYSYARQAGCTERSCYLRQSAEIAVPNIQ